MSEIEFAFALVLRTYRALNLVSVFIFIALVLRTFHAQSSEVQESQVVIHAHSPSEG